MSAAVSPFIADAGAVAAAIVAVTAALGILSRARPVRWVFSQLVAEPAGVWLDERTEKVVVRVVEPRVAEIRSEMRPNGGNSLHDRLFARLESLEAGQRKIFAHIDDTPPAMGDAPDPKDTTGSSGSGDGP